jgi:hypothetical protein
MKKLILFLIALCLCWSQIYARGSYFQPGLIKRYDLGLSLNGKSMRLEVLEDEYYRLEVFEDKYYLGLGYNPTPSGLTYLKRFTFIIGDKKYNLDSSEMYNAWGNKGIKGQDTLERALKVICADQNTCVIRARLGFETNIFLVEWTIKKGKSSRTQIFSLHDKGIKTWKELNERGGLIMTKFFKEIALPK